MALFEYNPEATGKTFRESAQEDIDTVFFEVDEHAEWRMVNGKMMLTIMEDQKLQNRNAHWEGGAKQSFDEGVYKAVSILRVKAKDYGPRPSVGTMVKVDNRTFIIHTVDNDEGVYALTLERHRQ